MHLRLLAVASILFGSPSMAAGQDRRLGPKDQGAYPPTDTTRIAVGTMAPDFSLESRTGSVVTLSGYRGQKNVILVFYRGHW